MGENRRDFDPNFQSQEWNVKQTEPLCVIRMCIGIVNIFKIKCSQGNVYVGCFWIHEPFRIQHQCLNFKCNRSFKVKYSENSKYSYNNIFKHLHGSLRFLIHIHENGIYTVETEYK